MAVFNSFKFDDIDSTDYGVYITGAAVYNAPVRAVEMITVPGRNGAIAIDQGYFENIEVTYPAGAFAVDQSGFASKITDLRNALASRYTYKRLTDTYNPNEFRMGLYKDGLEVDAVVYHQAGQFDITFVCKPQRWLVSGETPQTFNASGTITNPTLFGAKPLLEVHGYGNLTLGTSVLTVLNGGSGANQVLYIDCEAQEAWEVVAGAKISRNDYIQHSTGDFPVLNAGVNTVGLGANMSRVIITPRWWRI